MHEQTAKVTTIVVAGGSITHTINLTHIYPCNVSQDSTQDNGSSQILFYPLENTCFTHNFIVFVD